MDSKRRVWCSVQQLTGTSKPSLLIYLAGNPKKRRKLQKQQPFDWPRCTGVFVFKLFFHFSWITYSLCTNKFFFVKTLGVKSLSYEVPSSLYVNKLLFVTSMIELDWGFSLLTLSMTLLFPWKLMNPFVSLVFTSLFIYTGFYMLHPSNKQGRQWPLVSPR